MKRWIPNAQIYKQIEKYAAIGLTQDQIAYNLHIHPSTFFEKKHHYPELDDAFKRGKYKGVKTIANKLFEHAVKGNLTAAIFFLKCNAGWREVIVNETNLNMQSNIDEIRSKVDNDRKK